MTTNDNGITPTPRTPQTSQQTVDLLSASLGVPTTKLKQPSVFDRPDGLHENVSEAEYHRRELGIISTSALKEFAKSPRHHEAWALGETEDRDTPALQFGRGFHCATLEPEKYARLYAVQPDFGDCRKTANKDARDRWRAEHQSATIIDPDDHARIIKMRDAVRNHSRAGKLIKAAGKSELTAVWTDVMSGLRGRARADYYTATYATIIDLKSTDDASEWAFRRDVANYHYDWQAAIYKDAFRALGVPLKGFLFVAVEKRPPYAVAVYTLDEAWIEAAHTKVRTFIQLMAACKRDGVWPSYPEKIQTLTAPSWVTNAA